MSEAKTIYLKDYQRPDFTITDVELLFELDEARTRVTNTMKIVRQNEGAKNLVLDASELELEAIWLNDLQLGDSRYKIGEETLEIYNVPAEFSIKIINIIYPQNNTELEGLYKSGNIFCTQNEPEGFRRITPYIDRPDVMATFKTTVFADKTRYPILLSNGNKAQCHDTFGERHGVTWVDPHPKPSYLFALVAGDLGQVSDSFTTMSGNEIELNIYCDKGNESKCSHAMTSLKKSMKWDEEVYGREYDLEIYNIVAVDSFNMGAMENKGLNVFNSHYVLANEDTATDANFMGIESVIAHEYFHNWTGNRITCRDWFQLTLKEGLTVFRDQCFSADMNSEAVQRIDDVKSLRERQFVEDASPTAHPIQPDSYIAINNFYTATVYEKGAEVIRMLHTLLGKEKYRSATDLYFATFDGQAVRTDDFLWAMREASGLDLTQFERWYHQSGTPTLMVQESYEGGEYSLTLTQKVPNSVDGAKQMAYYFPLSIALYAEDGSEILEETLIISQESETFRFTCQSKPILSLNRDFSAPIKVEFFACENLFLMKHDTNPFSRYEAAQNYAIATLEAMMRGEGIERAFVDAYGYLLDLDLDLSYKALLLELPNVTTLMQRQEVVDFEPIYEAKEALEYELATVHKAKLLELYNAFHMPSDDSLSATSMGKRALKNGVLKLLSASKDEAVLTMAKEQYESSVTMTDRIAALDILENNSAQLSAVALADFYAKYKNDTLVMNKYFAILAASSREGVLDRVMALQNDDAYSEVVPNLVRSLIGVFARNYKHFHAKDGLGYKFIAQKVLDIDKINPQIASGLCSAFKIYEKLNETNKNLMHNELECIISTHSLSKNVYEIVSKILKK